MASAFSAGAGMLGSVCGTLASLTKFSNHIASLPNPADQLDIPRRLVCSLTHTEDIPKCRQIQSESATAKFRYPVTSWNLQLLSPRSQ